MSLHLLAISLAERGFSKEEICDAVFDAAARESVAAVAAAARTVDAIDAKELAEMRERLERRS